MVILMKKTICKYAVVRFAPFNETGEFANVGVLLYSAESNFFDFILGGRKCFSRVNRFFRIIDDSVVEGAIGRYTKELQFLKEEVLQKKITAAQAFEFLVKPRATMLQFSNIRTAFTNSPSEYLSNVFSRTVLQNTESIEKTRNSLKTTLRAQLDALELQNPFRRHKFSKHGFETSLDFTQLKDDKPRKVIQPLDLSSKVVAKEFYELADKYEAKLSRMSKLGLLPNEVLVTFSLPNKLDDDIERAWLMVRKELIGIGLKVADIDNPNAIEDFAVH